MADMIGGTELKAAGLVAADTNHTAVEVGTCAFAVRMAWTACEVASSDELYHVIVEANTEAATSTWTKIGHLACLGAAAVTGGVTATAATGEIKAAFYNPYDYQIRLATYVNGTIATGINFSAKMFPVENLSVI
jgi:hypothetical protein